MGALVSASWVVPSALGLATQLAGSSMHELPTAKFVLLYVVANAALVPLGARDASVRGLAGAIGRLVAANMRYWLVVVLATAARRIWFHPLRHFPGDRLSPLTQLYEATFWHRGINGFRLQALHRQYGDFVRTGPSEISVNNVEAIKPLFDKSPDVQRGPYYEIGQTAGEYSLLTQRDSSVHAAWRRIWEAAFRGESVLDYNVRLEAHTQRMINVVERTRGAEVDAWKIMGNLGFDMYDRRSQVEDFSMVDLGFAKDAGMQDGSGDPMYKDYLHDYMQVTATLGAMRNVLDVLKFLPKDHRSKEFIRRGQKMFEDRLNMGTSRRDIFSHLLGKDEKTGRSFTKKQLYANSTLLTVAGGDSIGSVLTNMLRELALNPSAQEKLHAELETVRMFQSEAQITIDSLRGAVYLQAVIDESLRFWAGLPSGVQSSVIGTRGMVIADTFIPPGTVVRLPFFTLFRDERYFAQADRWIPERWTEERPELVKDRRAFIPWSQGAHTCIGKQLALNELRLALAKLVFSYRIALGPSYDEAEYRRHWKDYLAIQPGTLHMQFVKRTE